jgi:Ribonuclease G/E
LKDIHRQLQAKTPPNPLVYACPHEVAIYLLNAKREKLAEFERQFEVAIRVECA